MEHAVEILDHFMEITEQDKFPVDAHDLHFKKYYAGGVLKNAVEEEAAVRLLIHSQKKRRYVGVSWQELSNQWSLDGEEYKKYKEKWDKAHLAHLVLMGKYKDEKIKYNQLIRHTFGLAFFATISPIKPFFIPPSSPTLVYSVIMGYRNSSNKMAEAFLKLIDEGLIKKGYKNAIEYLLPTPRLLIKLKIRSVSQKITRPQLK